MKNAVKNYKRSSFAFLLLNLFRVNKDNNKKILRFGWFLLKRVIIAKTWASLSKDV